SAGLARRTSTRCRRRRRSTSCCGKCDSCRTRCGRSREAAQNSVYCRTGRRANYTTKIHRGNATPDWRDGFARYLAPVLVNEGQDIGLILEAHVGLRSQIVSPNATLRWYYVRNRAIDETAVHKNIPGMPAVHGWHEHRWNATFGDEKIQPLGSIPPQGLGAFFEFAARRWNIHIRKTTGRLDL